jgi:hypothetical protein
MSISSASMWYLRRLLSLEVCLCLHDYFSSPVPRKAWGARSLAVESGVGPINNADAHIRPTEVNQGFENPHIEFAMRFKRSKLQGSHPSVISSRLGPCWNSSINLGLSPL